MYNNVTVKVKNHKQIVDVLNAVSSGGQYKNAEEIAYQLGMLSAWIVRLSHEHHDVQCELKNRLDAYHIRIGVRYR